MTNIRGAEIVHRTAGAGPDLIWGHGLTSSMASEDLFGLVDWTRMQDHARITRYDARGHGESESSSDLSAYHWRELALDQLALADELGIDTYIAGGASMGCATALHAAVIAPERVTALLLAIPPTAWDSRPAQREAYEMGAHLVETGDIDALVASSRAAPGPDPLSSIPQWRDGQEAATRAADPVRLARVLRGAAAADFPDAADVASLHVPTMIMAWTGDPGHPTSTAERLVELMPHATLVTASTFRELRAWTDAAIEFLGSVNPA